MEIPDTGQCVDTGSGLRGLMIRADEKDGRSFTVYSDAD